MRSIVSYTPPNQQELLNTAEHGASFSGAVGDQKYKLKKICRLERDEFSANVMCLNIV